LLFFGRSDGARFDDVKKLLSFEKLTFPFGAVFGLFWENRSFFCGQKIEMKKFNSCELWIITHNGGCC
jgi:hypothetical protein